MGDYSSSDSSSYRDKKPEVLRAYSVEILKDLGAIVVVVKKLYSYLVLNSESK